MPLAHRQRGSDDGFVAVFFAFILVAVLALGAVVVDLGLYYAEGRQLQNGAESGALAVARTCATGATCEPAAAAPLADSNANDSTSTVDVVCGTAPGLTGCSNPAQRPRFDCRPASGSAPYVQVRTSTRRTDGGTLMPRYLSRAFSGGAPEVAVAACARVAYGAPSGLTSQLPLTISLCEWNYYTNNGTSFSPPPPYPPWPGLDPVIYFHNTKETPASSCPSSSSGADLPGGFGWLDTDEDCVATTDSGGWVKDDTGNDVPKDCEPETLAAMYGKLVYIPVFDDTNGLTGANGEYHIHGYAAFYLTGYRYSANKVYEKPSLVDGRKICTGGAHCISGFFTQVIAPVTGDLTGAPDLGVTIMRVTG